MSETHSVVSRLTDIEKRVVDLKQEVIELQKVASYGMITVKYWSRIEILSLVLDECEELADRWKTENELRK